MTAQSKEQDAADINKERVIKLLFMHVSLNMMTSILTFTTRTQILNELVGGDFTRTSQIMSTWTGVTAMLEFFINPTMGRMSDSYGRRNFMMMAPWASFILKSWVLINPSILSLTVEKILCDGLRTMCGTTMTTAALSDVVKGSDLAVYMAKMWSAMGLSIIFAPLVASFFSARTTYMLSIGMAGIQLVAENLYLEETLPEDQRLPFAGFVNPLQLFKLFNMSPKITAVTITLCLQFLIDVKILADPSLVLQLQTLNWSRELSQRYTTVIGLGLLFGGTLTKKSIGAFGPHGHTTYTQVVNAAASFLVGIFPSAPVMWINGLMGWYGNLLTNGTKALGTNLAVEAGMGKGEYAGLLANLRAGMVVLGPFLFGQFAYGIGQRTNLPGMPFIFAGCVAVLAEVAHQRVAKLVIQEAKKPAAK